MIETNVKLVFPSAVHSDAIEYNPNTLNSEYFGKNINYANYRIGNLIASYDKTKYSALEIQLGAMISRFERFLNGHG
jgi:hypothetical protein